MGCHPELVEGRAQRPVRLLVCRRGLRALVVRQAHHDRPSLFFLFLTLDFLTPDFLALDFLASWLLTPDFLALDS
jgi:hypothetical protein